MGSSFENISTVFRETFLKIYFEFPKGILRNLFLQLFPPLLHEHEHQIKIFLRGVDMSNVLHVTPNQASGKRCTINVRSTINSTLSDSSENLKNFW